MDDKEAKYSLSNVQHISFEEIKSIYETNCKHSECNVVSPHFDSVFSEVAVLRSFNKRLPLVVQNERPDVQLSLVEQDKCSVVLETVALPKMIFSYTAHNKVLLVLIML